MTDDRTRERTRGGDNPRDTTRQDGRVPPHNLDAEESLLGAALLSKTALEVLALNVRPEDFYKPAYGHVAAVLIDAFENGWPADPVTVCEELRRRKLIDAVGGPAVLLSLQASCPATSNAIRYATIVHDHATLRRTIGAAAEIAELGYSVPSDVHAAVARAQEIVGGVAAQNGTRSYSNLDVADVGSLLDGNLDPLDPDFLTRTDGRALLYAGKMHVLQAEPSSGKSWLALAAALEVLNLGGSVIYLDYEDTAKGILGRLLALGADPAIVRERFVYVQPSGPFGSTEKTELARLLAKVNPDLVVIDGVAEALTRDGYSEDSNVDFIAWTENFPRWIARTGAAVLMLDHVKKDPEGRGRYARGASAKLGAVDGASYEVKVVVPFSRHRDGVVKLVCAKDRPGGVGAIGETVAMIKIQPKADGARVVLTIDPNVEEVRSTDSWKPTILMEKVSTLVRSSQVPLTASTVKSMVHAEKPKLVSDAIARLLIEGFLREEKSGRVKVLRSVTAYHAGGVNAVPPPPPEPPPELDLEDPSIDPSTGQPYEYDDEPSNVTQGPWQPYDGEDF